MIARPPISAASTPRPATAPGANRLRNAFMAALGMTAAFGLSAARAEQPLLPTPFPSQLGTGSADFDATSRVQRHQRLVPTPYSRSLGPNALGDPAPQKRRRHQKPVKTPYPRQYR